MSPLKMLVKEISGDIIHLLMKVCKKELIRLTKDNVHKDASKL